MKHLCKVPVVVILLLSDWSVCSVYNEYSREDLLKYREEVRMSNIFVILLTNIFSR